MYRKLLGGLMALAFSAVAGTASATVIFDELGTDGAFNTIRVNDFVPIGLYTFSSSTTISSFAVYNAFDAPGNLKFLIWDATTGENLFTSAAKAFGSDGGTALANNTFKKSDPLSFTFLPGITYAIGAIADVATGWYIAFDSVSENGITALTGNHNVFNFASPTFRSSANCCSVPVKLFADEGSPTDVPEPATLALLGVGLLSLGWAQWRRVGRVTHNI